MEKNCCVFSVCCEIIHEFTSLETVTSEGPEVFSLWAFPNLLCINFNVESKLAELGIDCKIILN
jgi:hypothetical protein